MKKRLIEDSIECNFMDSPHSKDPVYHSHTKYEMLLILNDNILQLLNLFAIFSGFVYNGYNNDRERIFPMIEQL